MKEKIYVYTLEVHGMKCGMCESHINDIVRKNFKIKGVKSNHHKNITVIKSKEELDENELIKAISSTGYEVRNVNKELK